MLNQQRLVERYLGEVQTFACPIDHNEFTPGAQANQCMMPNALSVIDALPTTCDKGAQSLLIERTWRCHHNHEWQIAKRQKGLATQRMTLEGRDP
jgi:hypothetical protein